MKMTKKLVALSAAALAFGVTGAFAQQRNTTTTTTTTTTYVEEYEETTGTAYVEETELEEVETGTYTETRTYEAYVAVPVETTKESTYTVKQGKPQTTWSTADFIDPLSFHITNVLSSDILKLRDKFLAGDTDDDKKLYASEFGGLYESVVIDYDAKRLKFQLAPQVALAEKYGRAWTDNHSGTDNGFSPDATTGLNRDDLGLFWNGMDWFVEVFPFDLVSLELHHDIWIPGSYLPVADTNVASGNLGSSGFGLVLYPNDKLRIAATVPFSFDIDGTVNYFNAEAADYDSTGTDGYKKNADTDAASSKAFKFNFGIGADYKIGSIVTLGVTLQNLLDSLSVGSFVSITPNEKMFINVGYTYNLTDGITFDYWHFKDDWAYFNVSPSVPAGSSASNSKGTLAQIKGPNVINLAFGYDNKKLDLGIDALIAVSNASGYDLYIGVGAGYYFIPDTLHGGIKVCWAMDFAGSTTTPMGLGFLPNVTYTVGRSTFDAGLNLQFAFGETNLIYVKFPVSWTYRFI